MAIEIKFLGGLGNQMFQYALYLRLKRQYPNQDFKLNVDSYKYVDFHCGFRLKKAFCIPEKIKLKSQYSFFSRLWYMTKVNIKKFLYVQFMPSLLVTDKKVTSDLNLQNPQKHYFVVGTWADERFFSLAKKEVKSLLSFVSESLKDTIWQKGCAIKDNCNVSVAIHIRRGDYKNTKYISLAETDYYDKALSLIKKCEQNEKIKLYIFSDEPDWCEKNLEFIKNNNNEFIKGNQDYEDLFLMSMCKYIVIANSTFSWWGAYLSNATIFAPKYYVRGQKEPNSYPKGWIVI